MNSLYTHGMHHRPTW